MRACAVVLVGGNQTAAGIDVGVQPSERVRGGDLGGRQLRQLLARRAEEVLVGEAEAVGRVAV